MVHFQGTPNSAYMEFGYMDFFGDFLVIWNFSLINCSIWTILSGTNVVHISEIGCIFLITSLGWTMELECFTG